MRPRLRALPRWTYILQPAAAGAIIGVIGIWYPQVMGAGYEHMDEAMHDQYAWSTLAVLAGLKLLATVLSFASGTPGGLFAPTLFMGAMLGGAVCGIARMIAPDVTGPIGAYALVGMGTLFAGILRAPMTSVFMMVEVSGNYSIVLPVMISNSIAYMISRRFQPTPIFEVLSHQDGVLLPSMEEQREAQPLRVEDAMHETTLVLDGGMTVSDARAFLEGAPDGVVPVLLPARSGRAYRSGSSSFCTRAAAGPSPCSRRSDPTRGSRRCTATSRSRRRCGCCGTAPFCRSCTGRIARGSRESSRWRTSSGCTGRVGGWAGRRVRRRGSGATVLVVARSAACRLTPAGRDAR